MLSDTVVRKPLLHNFNVLILLLLIMGSMFFYIDLSDTTFAKFLFFINEDAEQSGSFIRLGSSVILSIFIIVGLVLISFLKHKTQTRVIWAVLTLLFFSFFYLFDLSITFIQSKIWFLITQGLGTTLYISVISIIISTIIAMIAAIAKLSDNGIAYGIASFYTSLFRGLPLLIQIYLIYVGLPQLGFVIDAIPAGIAALSLCYGAYMAEIFRAGIQSLPRGQWEAARALGLGPNVILRKIILPQAIPLVIPPIGNQFISMLKDSSLVSVIGVWELMYLARTAGNQTFQHMEMLITAALIYWLITIFLEVIQAKIEKVYHYAK